MTNLADLLDVKDQIKHPSRQYECFECGQVIQRNVAVTKDGRTHHFGCLKAGPARVQYHCNSCGADLRRGETNKTYLMGVPARSCMKCGAVGSVISAKAHANTWSVV